LNFLSNFSRFFLFPAVLSMLLCCCCAAVAARQRSSSERALAGCGCSVSAAGSARRAVAFAAWAACALGLALPRFRRALQKLEWWRASTSDSLRSLRSLLAARC
jgi:hypothetical protein